MDVKNLCFVFPNKNRSYQHNNTVRWRVFRLAGHSRLSQKPRQHGPAENRKHDNHVRSTPPFLVVLVALPHSCVSYEK